MTFFIGRWLFFRGLALSYLFAFASLAFQIEGLIGIDGILPAQPYLQAVAENIGAERFWRMPTLFWIDASNTSLLAVCWLGVLASLVLLAGALHRPMLLLCWALFLSISQVGRDFLAFQWDILLLEVGLASLLIAPKGLYPKLALGQPMHRLALLAMHAILFKLMFSSGVVKLNSGDETWRSLTALLYHYETQPLATWVGWYAHQLPEWFQRTSVIGVFWIQLLVPFGIFLPRPIRRISAASLLALQGLIAMTGNYCYFNLLAVSLIMLALDDALAARWFLRVPLGRSPRSRLRSLRSLRASLARLEPPEPKPFSILQRRILIGASSILLSLDAIALIGTVFRDVPEPLHQLQMSVRQLRSSNGYGLFAVMTTVRREIVIEGSNDKVAWLPYILPHQPGPLARAPSFVAPHQPRLDWQMWFAALGSARQNRWFIPLMKQLLEGSDDVRSLFAGDPFPDEPPRFVRARIYRYRFTDLDAKRTTGHWWRRDGEREYLPAISLEDL